MLFERRNFITEDAKHFLTSNNLQFQVRSRRTPVNVSSFGIRLYRYSGDRTNVRKNVSNPTDVYGTLRKGSSIINPVIEIYLEQVFTFNYVFIPIFSRYYFINDIVSIGRNMWEIHMHVDVLYSFAGPILDTTARVLRSESNRNVHITDTLIPPRTVASSRYVTGTLTTAAGSWLYPKVNQGLRDVSSSSGAHILVKLAAISYQPLSAASEQVTKWGYIWIRTTASSLGALIRGIALSGIFEGDVDISKVILDVKWLPTQFALYNEKPIGYIRVGGFPFFSGSAIIYTDPTHQVLCYGSDEVIRSKSTVTFEFADLHPDAVLYRNTDPYKTMAIDFTPFGQIPLNTQVWGSSTRFLLDVDVDILSGDAILYIRSGSPFLPGYRERLASANVALPIELDGAILAQRNVAESLVSGLSSAGLGILGSFITANPLPAIAASVGGAGKAIMGSMPPPAMARVSGSGGANANVPDVPTLIINQLPQDDPDPHRQGYLLNTTVKLREISGLCIVAGGGVHLDAVDFKSATDAEKTEIERMLTSGVVLP